MCARARASACAHTLVHVHELMNACSQNNLWESVLSFHYQAWGKHLYPFILRQGLPAESETCHLDKAGWTANPRDSFFSASPALEFQVCLLVLGFLYGSRGTKLKSSLLCGKHFPCGTIFSPLWIFKKIPAWLLVPSHNLVGVFFHGEGKRGLVGRTSGLAIGWRA